MGMRETIYIKQPPFSVNSMFYRDQRIKTGAARDWERQVLHQLSWSSTSEKLAKLRDAFDPSKHAYKVTMIAYYPLKTFYTKAGSISAKTMDCSNWEKPLQDLIFSPRYFDQEPPAGCKNLNCDDKFVVSLLSKKLPKDIEEPELVVRITIIDKPKI